MDIYELTQKSLSSRDEYLMNRVMMDICEPAQNL